MSNLIDLDGGAERIAVFGGVYNNHRALRAVIRDAQAMGAQRIFNLGDVGGFGPNPDTSVTLLREAPVLTMQGNYDESVGNGLEDCQCGYTNPRDNHYAELSYLYTLNHTNLPNRRWLRDLPGGFRLKFAGRQVHMAHGSPRRINEFLWASTTPAPFVERLLREHEADLVLVTHTGLHWQRFVEPGRGLVNVGAIGRPANDGDTAVWYALLTAGEDVEVEFRRVEYDHVALAAEMRDEGLPEVFVETIETGWWTTCLEILPAKERAASRF